ncbi:MAG TPA: MSHA biogenesis protein MshJ [Oxalobacteraceae bacterium]|nr:MSHA biogenesis protein MshJ [Oxalobacteraceae bacterium]
MKQRILEIAKKIDALSLRERVILFGAAVAVMLFLINSLFINPQFIQQKKLADQIAQDQAQLYQIQALIEQKMKSYASDPNADLRLRLQQLQRQQAQLQGDLQEIQQSLVTPDKMAGLLEDILQRQGRLRLLSLKTLPVAGLNGLNNTLENVQKAPAAAGAAVGTPDPADKAGNAAAGEVLYRHGVEITLEGSYPDMLEYLAELEKMPWHLFWGKARLEVEVHPKATLTLTLFTLSLDKKWLNL